MPEKFQQTIARNFPFLKGKKLLLAVSGGIDSIVMSDIFFRSEYNIAIAHCNFNLRGEESDGDEKFVQEFAVERQLQIFASRFDTEAFASDNKLSIQVAARRLRYAWFDELIAKHDFDFVLTAHHADDNLETFLINLSRGTGLDGLVGIPSENGKIVRPLLHFSRKEIEDYAEKHQIEWREDSSNSSDKYLRNQLRHDIVPALKNLNPNFLESFSETLSHLKESQSLAEDASVLIYKQVASENENQVVFKIGELKRLPNHRAYLYQWLKDFGFTAWNDIYDLVDAPSGKQIFSPDFVLLKDRDVLILSPIRKRVENEAFLIDGLTNEISVPINLTFSKVSIIGQPNQNRIFVDADKLSFPLTLRRWREGDEFQPFGMSGNKKVSKYFKDEKFSLIDKANAWLLCANHDILWIVGHRADDRFKVTHTTKQILQITAS